MFCNLKIYIEQNKREISAIIDTGNFLRDPITKTPVVVVEKDNLKGLIPDVILENLVSIINGKEIELGEYASRIRVIPFKSLGKENGLLVGIKINKVEIEYLDTLHKNNNVILGIYNGKLSRSGKYSGLIGIDIIT